MDNEKENYHKKHNKKYGFDGHYCRSGFCGCKFTCHSVGLKLVLEFDDKINRIGGVVPASYCPFCGFKSYTEVK